MLSNLTGYIFGSENQVATADEGGVVLNATVTDGDWILIDSPSTKPLHVAVESAQMDSVSSKSSTPTSHTTVEDNWFVTPPACFTSRDPVHLETSSLENLLIEHPSMSVYVSCLSSSLISNVDDDSPGPDSPVPAATAPQTPAQPNRTTTPLSSQATLTSRLLGGFRRSQKAAIQRQQHSLCRHQLDRTNLIRHVMSSSRRQRRSNFQGVRCSGANNNRKC